MIGIVSAAFNKIYKDHFKVKEELNNVIFCIPTGTKGVPNNIEDVRMENDSPSCGLNFKLIDNPFHETRKYITKETYLLRNFSYRLLNQYIVKLVHYILPMFMRTKIFREKSKEFEILFSNVAGPRETLAYSGCKILEMLPFTTCGLSPLFIPLVSYDGKIRFSVAIDKNLNLDPAVINKYLDIECDQVLQEFSENHKED